MVAKVLHAAWQVAWFVFSMAIMLGFLWLILP